MAKFSNNDSMNKTHQYQRQVFGARRPQKPNDQYNKLAAVFEDMVEEQPAKSIQVEKVETKLEKLFRQNKTKIMKALRALALQDPAMVKFRQTGSLDDLKAATQNSTYNKHKWDILLKYADVWDDDLKNISDLELKQLYAVSKRTG